MKINIAIDGYAGCGKSTLAKSLAIELDYTFIDTGALYRGVTFFMMNGLGDEFSYEISDKLAKQLLEENPQFAFKVGSNHLLLNGDDIESEIRSSKVASNVSMVAAFPAVRSFLLGVQRKFITDKAVVMEGRDIGTVIMPDAEAKFFITAEIKERVERRFLQLKESGEEISREEVQQNLSSRDFKDANRAEAPLSLANDAIVLDTTYLNREEQLKCIIAIIKPKVNSELLPFLKA